MVVLAIKIRLLILCLIFAKLVFPNQLAFQQKLNGVVERGPAYPVLFVFHIDIEGFYIKMVVTIIDFLEYGIPFRCFPMSIFLQEGGKYAFDYFLILIEGHANMPKILNHKDTLKI